ncbi:MAG: hypothetical protein ACM3S1_14685 [Hyphomicrobiales bacterium]
MSAPADVRLIQLARMLALEPHPLDHATARRALQARPGDFASAIFHEAADSDDVTSADSARAYLEDRLGFFGELLDGTVREQVRAAFEERLSAWE